MRKFLKGISITLCILAIFIGLFCLVGWLYGLATSQTFVETMHAWLPFLSKK